MKTQRFILAIAVLALLTTGSAWAERGGHGSGAGHGGGHGGGGHVHFGVVIGGGGAWRGARIWPRVYYPTYYYPYVYPYYPPTVVTAPPSVYVEQPPDATAPGNYWYYCEEAQAYYPYVSECASGWRLVVPQPAN